VHVPTGSRTDGQPTYGYRREGFLFVAAIDASADPYGTDREVKDVKGSLSVANGAKNELEPICRDSRIQVSYMMNELWPFEEGALNSLGVPGSF
jgi:hypothetical protein